MIETDAILEIDWPPHNFDIPFPCPSLDIFAPKEPYNRENM
jgi:hypothetical protein